MVLACFVLRLTPAVCKSDGAGGARVNRVSLVGRVETFEGQLDYYLPEEIRNHPERSNIPIERLGFALDARNLTNVMLGFHEPNERYGLKLSCHGPPCPSFGSCSNSNSDSDRDSDSNGSDYGGGGYHTSPNVEACWNPGMEDLGQVFLPAPVNCPKSETFELPARPYSGRDKTCSHKQDFNPRDPTALQVFRLRHVYVSQKGFVFNASHQFVHNGCARLASEARFPASHPVHRVPAVFNWAYGPGGNFYHFLIEGLPSFLVASTVLPSILKDTPILARLGQWRMYDRVGAALIGVERGSMRALPVESGDLFRVDTVYQPMLQDCGRPSHSLWTMLRRRHLLHPQGIPLFHPNWTYRALSPLTAAQAQALPPDWVVVVAKRPVKKRSITNFNEVEQLVERMFPRERIVVFNGSLSILEARDLFRRTRLFIAGHGAALTNVIFMPEKASVLEIRPDGCEIVCYNHLSYACTLTYHLIFSHGGCYDTVEADIPTVATTLESISRRFGEEDRKQGLDGSYQ
ncbi:hypothetical protein CLOM_g7321 [Closterium sp. NIES-68]|nr:hypothetical protein CLOM_g7321 [Closterium sp. NIES-68]GJP62616.1 hypothetical protein CLOP_g19654 [Closterium sp. NIES-67]